MKRTKILFHFHFGTCEGLETVAEYCFIVLFQFLADRTNGRAYATVLRLSVRLSVCLSVYLSVVCDVMYCG